MRQHHGDNGCSHTYQKNRQTTDKANNQHEEGEERFPRGGRVFTIFDFLYDTGLFRRINLDAATTHVSRRTDCGEHEDGTGSNKTQDIEEAVANACSRQNCNLRGVSEAR